MEIVLAHNNSDFDSLAAQFAVTKLHPAVRMVPGYPLPANIRNFLSLYRDCLPIVDLQYVEVEKIKHIFLVDCQHVERLDEIAQNLIRERKVSYTIFDHHHQDESGLGPGAREDSLIMNVGAATTVVVDQLRQRRIELTPFEATLLAIGIYEDTGCLTYDATSKTDALCVAYLLEQGADLNQVSNFLNPKLTEEQTNLFQQLVSNSSILTLPAAKVLIAQGKHPRYLEGLATLTRRLLEVTAAQAAVSIVHMRDRVHIVGRSDTPCVNVREVALLFGGDGHSAAASAVSKELSLDRVVAEVEDCLRRRAKPQALAGDIMRSPVMTIGSSISMDEAGRIMLRHSETGLVIVDGESVEGIIARRDIDKATHHKLSHAPVSGFMSRPVITIKRSTPLADIQHLMVKEDIGRLPVIDESGSLVGIVTRKELLSTIFGTTYDTNTQYPEVTAEEKRTNIDREIESLDMETRWLFETIGTVASLQKMKAYAVGGCVRDLLLNRKNFDLDFVVEGSAATLAGALEMAYPSRFSVKATYDRFQTATVLFRGARDREVDFTTARTEFYERPAALPTVEPSKLEQDLIRRDFTINALAVCLNPGEFGQLIDFFDGLNDLSSKLIRILHQFSFIEDPTRIIRAVRFATRLHFELEERTKLQAQRAISMGIFDNLSDFRLKEELKGVLESKNRIAGLELLNDLGGGLYYLAGHLHYDQRIRRLLRRAESLFSRYKVDKEWVVCMGLLLSSLADNELQIVFERLYLSNDERNWINRGIKLGQVQSLAETDSTIESALRHVAPSKIFEQLHGHSDQSLAIAACLAPPGSSLRRSIKLYLDRLRHVQIDTTGSDLMRIGIPQGPKIKDALTKLHSLRLDGLVNNASEELEFVRENYLEKNG